MNKETLLGNLYDVLDYLETDDYDDTCTTHIDMINKLKNIIKELETL